MRDGRPASETDTVVALVNTPHRPCTKARRIPLHHRNRGCLSEHTFIELSMHKSGSL
ncbi:unnamed protein product [Ixodes persulcatus]